LQYNNILVFSLIIIVPIEVIKKSKGKQGWLMKEIKSKNELTWEKFWGVLDKDCIYCYQDESYKKLKSVYYLPDYIIESSIHSISSDQNQSKEIFSNMRRNTLVFTNINSTTEISSISCSSYLEYDEWVWIY
jgi:hypothetical protein